MNKKVTIKDVAKEANVSVATVSRVINSKGYVYEETRKDVLAAIERLGFEPNQLARSLSNHKSNMIGVFVPHVSTQFYGDLIEGIEKAAINNGYKTMLCNIQDNTQRELDYLKICEQYSIDGIIVACNFKHVEELSSLNIPLVSIDHVLDENISSFESNNYYGGKLVGEKILATSAKNVLLLRGPSFLITSRERTEGLMDTIKDKNINITIRDYDLLNPDMNDIYEYLKNNQNIDFIFALSDTLALVALTCVQKLGKKVPNDIQIVGFDNSNFAKIVNPALSSVNQAVSQIGELAANTVLEMIESGEKQLMHKKVDVTLIERETTK